MARNINHELRERIARRYDFQADFAQAVGMSDTFVSFVITGRRPLPLEHHRRWADALGLTLEEFGAIIGDSGTSVPAAAATGTV